MAPVNWSSICCLIWRGAASKCELVSRIEQALIDLLAHHGVAAMRLDGAPGVYVGQGSDGASQGMLLTLKWRRSACGFARVAVTTD